MRERRDPGPAASKRTRFAGLQLMIWTFRRKKIRIEGFFNEYRFLSNFWPAVVELDGIRYPTVEHAYQAAKTLDRAARREMRIQKSPGKAKKKGGRSRSEAIGWRFERK